MMDFNDALNRVRPVFKRPSIDWWLVANILLLGGFWSAFGCIIWALLS